jgi:epoxyqueuosine reductase
VAEKETIAAAARRHGFDLAGVMRAADLASAPDLSFYRSWLAQGYHGQMAYLAGERAEIRRDLDRLLPGVRSVICVAMNYNVELPYSTALPDATRAWISRYAWGDDYHQLFREKLEALVSDLRKDFAPPEEFRARVAVDTSPILERALARRTAVGWMGKNTCLINQKLGSWLFLGEVLTTLELPPDDPAPDRCGSCTKCIEACPTGALLGPRVLDSRLCISYWTIEARGAIPEQMRAGIGRHVFGCDICQDVCPWNRKASATRQLAFRPRHGLFNPPLEELAEISEQQFGRTFRDSPIRRAGYQGFLRNVCLAIGNSGAPKFVPQMRRLAEHSDPVIREHAIWALEKLNHKDTKDAKITKSIAL